MATKKVTFAQLQRRIAPGTSKKEFAKIISDSIGGVPPRTVEGWTYGKTPHQVVRNWVELQLQQKLSWGVR